MRGAGLIDVAEELLAGQLLTCLEDARQAPIAQVDVMFLAALALEVKVDLRALDLDVITVQRGQSVRAIFARVFIVADANQRGLEQPHDRRQDFLARQSRSAQISLDAGAQPGQRFAERQQTLELRLVAQLAPALVIAILLAPALVAS